MRSLLAVLLAIAAAPACSTGDACHPTPGSCGGPVPSMYAYDAVNSCLRAPAPVAVCDTEVNACAASMGLGPVCAFAPDGTVYFATGSDNDVLTEAGWRFDQSYESIPAPFPADQKATAADHDRCMLAACAPPCPGVTAPTRVGLCP